MTTNQLSLSHSSPTHLSSSSHTSSSSSSTCSHYHDDNQMQVSNVNDYKENRNKNKQRNPIPYWDRPENQITIYVRHPPPMAPININSSSQFPPLGSNSSITHSNNNNNHNSMSHSSSMNDNAANSNIPASSSLNISKPTNLPNSSPLQNHLISDHPIDDNQASNDENYHCTNTISTPSKPTRYFQTKLSKEHPIHTHPDQSNSFILDISNHNQLLKLASSKRKITHKIAHFFMSKLLFNYLNLSSLELSSTQVQLSAKSFSPPNLNNNPNYIQQLNEHFNEQQLIVYALHSARIILTQRSSHPKPNTVSVQLYYLNDSMCNRVKQSLQQYMETRPTHTYHLSIYTAKPIFMCGCITGFPWSFTFEDAENHAKACAPHILIKPHLDSTTKLFKGEYEYAIPLPHCSELYNLHSTPINNQRSNLKVYSLISPQHTVCTHCWKIGHNRSHCIMHENDQPALCAYCQQPRIHPHECSAKGKVPCSLCHQQGHAVFHCSQFKITKR